MSNKPNLDEIIAHRIAEIPEEEANRVRDEASSSTRALQRKVARAEAETRAAKASVTQWQNSYRNLEGQLQEANSSHQRSRLASLWNRFNNWIQPRNNSIAEQLKKYAKILSVELVSLSAIAGIVIGSYFGVSAFTRKTESDSVLSYQLYWPSMTQSERGFFPNSSSVPAGATIKWANLNDIDNTVTLTYTTSQNVDSNVGNNATEQGIDGIINQLKPAVDDYAISALGIQRLEQNGDLKTLAYLIMAGGGLYQTNANGATPVINNNSTAADLYRLFESANNLFFQSPFSLAGGSDVAIQQKDNQFILLKYSKPNADYTIFPQILQLLGDKQ